MFAVLIWAAIEDVRTRRIRNTLTLTLALAGIAQSFWMVGTVSPVGSILGLLVGFSLGLSLFLLGGMGGGDVKLLAAVGAWMGPWGVLYTMVGAAIVALVIVLFNATRDGQLASLFRSAAVLVSRSIYARPTNPRQAFEVGMAHVSVGRPLPYAVPVLAASLAVAIIGV
ncbi:MAG TPA: A24 family peptidase [Tepidisphaeraceae bacterium]|nr:A24 family peptidase [Tepidisphaeraceae bacterium]